MMKKVLALILALSVCLTAGVVLAKVSGTPHDLTTATALEICAFCHTPHQGTGTLPPLWNRTTTAASYNMYTNAVSATFDMAPNTTPRSPSALCLMCHNGTDGKLVNYPGPGSTEVARYNATSGNIGDGTLDSWTNLGTDLRNEHPVSFNYLNSADLQNNGFPANAANGYIANLFPLYGAAKDWFECATCHAVHDTGGAYAGKGTSQVYFLRSTNAASVMCSACHVNR